MTKRVAFIRGINVGGNRLLPMAELRAMLGGLGFDDVRTYIQSGNAVYAPPAGTPNGRDQLNREAAAITAAIDAASGFAPVVMVFTVDGVSAHLARSPFHDADPAKAFIVFVDGDADQLATLPLVGNERAEIIDGVVHLHLPDGIGTSKAGGQLAASTKPATTTRNLRTLAKVLELGDDS